MSASTVGAEGPLSVNVSGRQRRQVLALVLTLGLVITFWQLGSTGVVDETPPLFAAAGRAMADTGDWLTPRVNGLPRYDKPPLVYWLMGFGYVWPGREVWDPLGSWAAKRLHCSNRLRPSRPHSRASLTAVRLQTSTSGEKAKARGAIKAVKRGRASPENGQRSIVSARQSISPTVAKAEGSRAAQLPSGSQTSRPGRA